MSKKAVMIMGDGFEEVEAVAPADILRRGGVSLVLASAGGELGITGSHGISLKADKLLENCIPEEYDMVVVPGGPGVQKLLACNGLDAFILKIWERGGWVASICAGPRILAKAGVLRGLRATSYPSEKEAMLPHVGEYVEDGVVTDGKVITARGAGYAVAFGLVLLEKLVGRETATQVGAKMLVPN